MEETMKSTINSDRELVELTRTSGFLSDYYTVVVDGKEKSVHKNDLNSAMKDFEKWS